MSRKFGLTLSGVTGNAMVRVTGPQGSSTRRRFLAYAAILFVLPVGLAFVLGWNGVGMLKPWPNRWIGVLYWLVVTSVLWWISFAISIGARRLFGEPARTVPFAAQHLFFALLAINIFRPFNIGVAWMFAGHFGLTTDRIAPAFPASFANFLEWQMAFLPFIILWVAGAVAVRHFALHAPTNGETIKPEPIDGLGNYIDNLPHGDLISVSAEDHYVRVYDRSGADQRFRCSFAEALDTLKDKDGFKVHRSHWVARSHIEKLESTPTKASVVLSNGRRLPVSAPNRDAILLALARRKL